MDKETTRKEFNMELRMREYDIGPCPKKCGRDKFTNQRMCSACLSKETKVEKEKMLLEAGYTRCKTCKTLLPPK